MSSFTAPQGVATHLSANGLIGVTWTGVALGVAFTSIRIAIRVQRMKHLLADDYFVLFGLALLITNAVLQTIQAPHLYYMSLTPTGEDIKYHALRYVHLEFVIIGLFWSILWCIKGSFLALFWMISDGLPKYRRVCAAISIFTFLAYVGCWIASALNCHPPSDYFRFGKCTKPADLRGSVISISYSTAVDIITDLMIMGLPLRILVKSKITRQQKIGLGVVFCVGFIIIAIAVVRAVQITGKAYSDQVNLAIWSIAESSISVIVGCLPPFKSFISRNSSTNQYPYGSSGYAVNHYDRSATSARKKRSLITSLSEVPLPLHDMKPYRDLGYESHRQNVHITGGVDGQDNPGNTSWFKTSDDEPRGEIRMVKEFSMVSSR
ncbi:hypothetical protein ANOM_009221 [Aspergillus nomiae NRRL 13137]|uniref:Rhodopsin domain-containing protein n=1 Tax=Aspergillus nomiae NRRL (strain ATCC 15546 / NRRL 13137 / CBS 260.88 / M93) TaxID=1509407 RepID=A0A0L1INX7_ASPN3|nr:uncharacterized protein ANOM_009221 [Aspergillus nomiae NRRL 13137]KNG81232.1 hypothetical protein ANOM_009221 [Aspergillus nomiae NRRL 13137]